MELINMFYAEIEAAKKANIPFILPIGTLEYHGYHASCGTDTMVITGCLRELAKEKEIVVCPPLWYGVASYAVCEPRPGHFHVDEDVYTNYLYEIIRSMVEAGIHNIYCIAHHQTEADGLMPMTIACHKVAKKIAMAQMEKERGRGWWGSNDFADYYENLGGANDPLQFVKVLALMGADTQIKCGGFDHAGKWETSLLMGVYPENVELARCEKNYEWFTADAIEASEALGKHMVNCTLEWLREKIQ